MCFLPLCSVSQGLCSLSVPGKQEGAELHTVLRSEITGKNTCLDSLQWLSSVTFYLKDYPFCCYWWNFILFHGWVIILLKIYKHAFLQIKYPCFTRDLGPPRPSFFAFFSSTPVPRSRSVKTITSGAQTGTWRRPFASGRSDCGPPEVSKCGDMRQTAGKPHHFSTWLHHLCKVQGLLVSCQLIEACLQTVVEHYPWFPDEGNFNLEIWNEIKENVKKKKK